MKVQIAKTQANINEIKTSKDEQISQLNQNKTQEILELVEKKKNELMTLDQKQFTQKLRLMNQHNNFPTIEIEHKLSMEENIERENSDLDFELQKLKNTIEVYNHMRTELNQHIINMRRLEHSLEDTNSQLASNIDRKVEKRTQIEKQIDHYLYLKSNRNKFNEQKQERIRKFEAQQGLATSITKSIGQLNIDLAELRREYTKRHNSIFLTKFMLKHLKERYNQQMLYTNKLADTSKLVKILKNHDEMSKKKKFAPFMSKIQTDFKENM